jgi:hypothetical protein
MNETGDGAPAADELTREGKPKRPWYKKKRYIIPLVVILLLIVSIAVLDDPEPVDEPAAADPDDDDDAAVEEEDPDEDEPAEEPEREEPEEAEVGYAPDEEPVHRIGEEQQGGRLNVHFVLEGADDETMREMAATCVDHYIDDHASVYCYGFPSIDAWEYANVDDSETAGMENLCWTARENLSLSGDRDGQTGNDLAEVEGCPDS